MKEEDFMEMALDKWGVESQINMVLEECAELIQALSHKRRGRCGWDHVASEIADLEITLGSVKCHIERHDSGLLEREKKKKLERAEKLFNDEEQ